MILRISIGAFLQSAETRQVFESIMEDRIFLRSSIEVQDGGIDQAARYLSDHPTPNLLIVESTAQTDQMMNQLNVLADVCAPGTNVILIGAQNDVHLYRELIDVGIGDYLVSPVNADQIKESILALYDSVGAEESGRVIAFFGVSGGVGSSIVAHNVAYELMKEYDEEVILIDLDITYGTGALVFNMQPRQTIVDALTSNQAMDEAMLDQYMFKFEEKLSILPAPASLGTGYHINGESLDKVINLARGMAEFVVLDVPHLWEAWVPEVLAGADEVELVCKPDLSNLRNAKNLLEYLGPKRDATAPTRLIFNQEGGAKKTDLGDKDFRAALAKEPAISIPFEPDAFGRALNNGEVLSKAAGKAKATKAIQDLAKMVSGRNEEEGVEGKKKKGLSLFKRSRSFTLLEGEPADPVRVEKKMFGRRGTQPANTDSAPASVERPTPVAAPEPEPDLDLDEDLDEFDEDIAAEQAVAAAPAEKPQPANESGKKTFGGGAAAGAQPAQPKAPEARPSTLDLVTGSDKAVKSGMSDRLAEIKVMVFNDLLEAVDLAEISKLGRAEVREEITDMVAEIISMHGLVLTVNEQKQVVKDICNDILGLGPLEPLIERDDIADIMVNGPNDVYIETGGKIELTDIKFRDNAQLMNICQRIVTAVGRRVDESSPICDARLADGSRVNVIAPPLAIDGAALTIRKFTKEKLTLEKLVDFGSATEELAEVLRIASASRCNILISGGTGSGKTTLLNCMTRYIDNGERVITCEDAAELQLQQPHVVRLETRPPNLEGAGQVTMTDLVKNCLRMRPERIIVGEVRGSEAFDLLQAMNTGHDGSMGTIHANNPREAISRVENMIAMGGYSLPAKAVREQIAAAVHVIIQAQRLRDGSRKITHVTEVIGMEGDIITLQDLFLFEFEGEDENGKIIGSHRPTGMRPHFWDRARYHGHEQRLAKALNMNIQ